MSQDASAKRAVPRRRLLVSAVIGTIVLLIVFALVALTITPVKYDIVVGEVAPATITSSRDITDEITTEAQRQDAREAVSAVYARDPGVTTLAEESISGYMRRRRCRRRACRMNMSHSSLETAVTG